MNSDAESISCEFFLFFFIWNKIYLDSIFAPGKKSITWLRNLWRTLMLQDGVDQRIWSIWTETEGEKPLMAGVVPLVAAIIVKGLGTL